MTLDKADLTTFSTNYRAGDWDAVVYNYTNSSPSLSGAAALFSGSGWRVTIFNPRAGGCQYLGDPDGSRTATLTDAPF